MTNEQKAIEYLDAKYPHAIRAPFPNTKLGQGGSDTSSVAVEYAMINAQRTWRYNDNCLLGLEAPMLVIDVQPYVGTFTGYKDTLYNKVFAKFKEAYESKPAEIQSYAEYYIKTYLTTDSRTTEHYICPMKHPDVQVMLFWIDGTIHLFGDGKKESLDWMEQDDRRELEKNVQHLQFLREALHWKDEEYRFTITWDIRSSALNGAISFFQHGAQYKRARPRIFRICWNIIKDNPEATTAFFEGIKANNEYSHKNKLDGYLISIGSEIGDDCLDRYTAYFEAKNAPAQQPNP